MILLRSRILEAVEKGEILIEPFNPSRCGPNSYNLSLHNELLVYEEVVLDAKTENRTKKVTIPESGYRLDPRQLYLGRTVERTATKEYVPLLEGRSSIGRLGMAIHISAGFGDIGFDGFWTLEITVQLPLVIYPNMEICQIYYHETVGKKENLYQGKYQNNQEIQASMLHLEYDCPFKSGDKVRVIREHFEGIVNHFNGIHVFVLFPIKGTKNTTSLPYLPQELEHVP